VRIEHFAVQHREQKRNAVRLAARSTQSNKDGSPSRYGGVNGYERLILKTAPTSRDAISWKQNPRLFHPKVILQNDRHPRSFE
jgi:hypothetical protein